MDPYKTQLALSRYSVSAGLRTPLTLRSDRWFVCTYEMSTSLAGIKITAEKLPKSA